jgi:Zn-dependent protease with chaperone function
MSIGLFIIVQLIQILVMINQRKNEYQADDFACANGYGEDLLETLYILKDIDLGGNLSLLARLKCSHPHLGDRILRLEEK